MPDDNHNNMTYKHKSAPECQAFLTKLRSKSRSKGENVFKVFNSSNTPSSINNAAHGLNGADSPPPASVPASTATTTARTSSRSIST